jgi:hypothetical protein
MHIPATLLIDLQTLYPAQYTPQIIAALPKLYINMSKDPLIAGVFSDPDTYLWLKCFMGLEA